MPFADPQPSAAALDAFIALCGESAWRGRLADLGSRARSGSLSGRAAQHRHALELALARLCDKVLDDRRALARASLAERRLCAFAGEAVQLAESLPPIPRDRLRQEILAGLTGEGTLIPLFHLLRTAAQFRSRGFAVRFAGLAEGAPHDLLVERDGATAAVACETVSAEEGRPLHRGDWYALVDRINPGLQNWLAAHPGRYLLKMTLPEGIGGPDQLAGLQQRISGLLAAERQQDAGGLQAVLKLDPLILAGAQAQDQAGGLPARLRAQFGPEAHLAVTADSGSGSVFVMAARVTRENEIAAAVCRRLALAAERRLSGREPGILSVLLEDVDRTEWQALRERLELEGAVRRFLTAPVARRVVAVSCASRLELFGASRPDGAEGGSPLPQPGPSGGPVSGAGAGHSLLDVMRAGQPRPVAEMPGNPPDFATFFPMIYKAGPFLGRPGARTRTR
ncbi:hypothetical protein [Siccirubricoccus sp. G192]|uniref:hypothetical protein n=1 Tax=Siccirubricoccus sp. G192 TaxID=2849651 RepID=UPI001C2C36E2|nr:hypothetical protein [Siccirubricoccus sp. G192]MBV1797153.1 hypothetical protein [Siccirubricoccus sp. G192]